MKARLVYVEQSYQLISSAGIKKLSAHEARKFLESFDSELYYVGRIQLDFSEFGMMDYAGLTVATVNDEGALVIASASHFRQLLAVEEINYLSPLEFAELHGKKRSVVSRLCRESRISGVKKKGNSWLIPENAPYPEDKRIQRG